MCDKYVWHIPQDIPPLYIWVLIKVQEGWYGIARFDGENWWDDHNLDTNDLVTEWMEIPD